ERDGLERPAGDHLQLAALARLGTPEPPGELPNRLGLARCEAVGAVLRDPARELRIPHVPPEPAGDEGDQPVVRPRLRARGHTQWAKHLRRPAALSTASARPAAPDRRGGPALRPPASARRTGAACRR